MKSSANAPLYRREKLGLALFGLLVIAFGIITEIRSAFQNTRKTDVGVYLRAGWAARTGHDVFDVIDDNGWHYCYPPTFALLISPLGDPMPGQPREGFLPYALSVAVWYLFSVVCLAWAAHVLASAVLPDAICGSRRWWYARIIPIYVCIGGLGFTLGRGQVNILVVAFVSTAFAAAVSNRRMRSGMWFACAIALKVIPAYLLLFPFVRRDRRAFVGVALGLVVLLGIIPTLWWGFDGMVEGNRKVVELVLKPGATGDGDQTRAKELTGTTSTDSQSFQALIHAMQHPDPESRPMEASRETRLAHIAICGLLTGITFWIGWRRLGPAAGDQLVYLGCLCSVMLLASPVSHMHYYAFAFPLVAGLWLRSVAQRPGEVSADRRTTLILIAWGLATALPLFPGELFDRLRQGGFGVAATVALWAVGITTINRSATIATARLTVPLRIAA